MNFESAIQDALNNTRSFLEPSELTKLRISHAEQQRLGQVISALAGIERATAQYREFKTGSFPPEIQRKAVIAASGKGNRPINPAVINVIRATAAGWWGIRPDDVVVTDLNSQHTYLPETEGLGKESKLYAEAKLMYEQTYQNKIYDCLSVYPGVVVGVNVEMDPDMAHESTKITVDPQTIPLESETYRKTLESGPAPGGRPGAVPNEVAGNVPREVATTASQKSSTDENREQQRSITGHEQTNRRKAPFVPTTVTATVSVPRSYYRQLWKQDPKNATPPGEEPKEPSDAELGPLETMIKEQIESKVAHVLPPMAAGDSPFKQVEVSTYGDLPVPSLEEPSLAASTLAWFADNWQTLGLFGVGVTSLLFLRSMIRSATPAAASAAPAAAPQTTQEEEEEAQEEAPAILHRRTRTTGGSLRDELTAMVREDPDAAANVLRTWIGDAA